MDDSYPCPSCGFRVFYGPPGSYEICPLCNWEDDHVQLRFPAMRDGANKGSLYEYQQNALRKYPVNVRMAGQFVRLPEWRPLSPSELVTPSNQPKSGMEYFDVAAGE